MNKVVGRFAPTPSGRMHLGNVFAALIAWLSVRSKKGELVLLDLELDLDDGRLRYEGEAVQGGKRYEFEISVNGRMIDWERD